MKNLFLCLSLLFAAATARAQDTFRRFEFEISGSTSWLYSGSYHKSLSNALYGCGAEFRYNPSQQFDLGIQLNCMVGDYMFLSEMIMADYLISRKAIRPFIGAGIGHQRSIVRYPLDGDWGDNDDNDPCFALRAGLAINRHCRITVVNNMLYDSYKSIGASISFVF